ncbi:MAG: mismatch-specific DNA-glycosylase [Telmatospirillum sp.]|nr:mismatch-specific DNA-glycosylase [Telmatospirillum sp.]
MAGRAETLAPGTAGTLPDLLADGLALVFVGINPSVYSARQGHYFARPSNRFWRCLSRSALSAPARRVLGVDRLEPRHDRHLMEHGIGFTDVVKRPTPKASDLSAAEFEDGVRDLLVKLRNYAPGVACFQGVTGYRPVLRVLGGDDRFIRPGLQDLRVGQTRIFLVPSPSGANAHCSADELTGWYDRLAAELGLAV